jgi:hypothetical protein
MEQLKNILIKNNFAVIANIGTKNMEIFILLFELNQIDQTYVNLAVKRQYKHTTIEIKNEKRKISKLVGSLKKIIDQSCESYADYNDAYHCQIYCEVCEENIKNKICHNIFNKYEGYVGVHGIQYGKCVMMIDNQCANNMLLCLGDVKSCSSCVVEILKK